MIGFAWTLSIVGGFIAGAALYRVVHRAHVFDDLVDYRTERRRRDPMEGET